MWSPRLLRSAALGLALAASLALAGCSGFRPVYGESGVIQERLELNYAKPSSRLEQIIIQDLALRLGSGRNPDAPIVRIVASSAARTLTRTAVVKPSTQHELTVTASYAVTSSGGETLISGTRRASATYSSSGQVLADEAAVSDATERAGHEVAETIRLTILAELAAPPREATASR